jgi:hypothetical protein
MSDTKLTLGKAIDQIIEALTPFEEKDRRAIVNTVCLHLQIDSGAAVRRELPHGALTREGPAREPSPQGSPRTGSEQSLDIKALKAEKNPQSARQMACLVAFYLHEHAPQSERKQTITTADLEKYFKQAGYKLPKKLEQLLIDSKHAGYFDSPKRGEYQLTRVGYNLVAHSLPSKTGA